MFSRPLTKSYPCLRVASARFSTQNKQMPTRKISTQQAKSSAADPYFGNFEEPVRPEYIEMLKEFDYLVENILPDMRQHYLDAGRPLTNPLNKFALPPEIIANIGEVKDEPASLDECLTTLRNTMKYSLKTLHPFFNDKLYAGADPVGQVSEFLVALLNTAVHVYHVAPVFSVMEVECVKILGREFGFDEETVDGTLNPGGTMTNMMSVFAARQEHFPHVRLEGWKPEDRPVAFTPTQSHYSIARGAMLSGMGMNQMVNVPCDRHTG